MSKKIIIIFSISLFFILVICFLLFFLNSKKIQNIDTDLLKNKNLVNETIDKISKLSTPVFTEDDPSVIIEEVSQAINPYSPIKFAPLKSNWQWWISDNGWNILDENAVASSINIPVISAQDKYTGEFQPKGPKHPLSQALNKFISDTFKNNGFQLNATNTSKTETDENLFDYVISFQKGKLRCTLNTSNGGAQTDEPNSKDSNFYVPYSISCSNQFDKAYQEQVPYLKALEDRDSAVILKKRIGDYVYLNVGFRVGGFFIIGKMEGEKIKIIFTGQEYPPCNLMENNQVPKEVYEKCDESNYPYTPPANYKNIYGGQ